MPNPSYVSLRTTIAEKEGQVQAASQRKAQLQADIAQLASKQASEPGVAAEQAKLNRDYDVLKRQYDKLVEDREQLRLRSDVQSKTASMTFRVIDPPSLPTVPVSPKRPLLLDPHPVRGAGRGHRRGLRQGPAPGDLPDPEQARRRDRPAGARHRHRSVDRGAAFRRRGSGWSGCSAGQGRWARPTRC